MILPVLPLFLSSTLGVAPAFIGLIEGIADSTSSLLKVFSGWFSDKVGKRKSLVVVGYTVSTLSKPFLFFATGWVHVLVVRFADRVGKGVRTSPRDAMIADTTLPEQRGKAFGFHRAADTAGAVVGPLLLFILLPLFANNYRPIFLISLIPAFLAVLGLVLFTHDTAAPVNKRALPKLRLDLFDRRFKFILGVVTLFTLGNFTYAFVILRAQSLGVSDTHIPLIYLCFNLVYALVSMPAGMLSDKIGRSKVMVGGYLVYAFTCLGFVLATQTWHAWALFALYGVFNGLTEPSQRAFVTDLAPENLRGTALGIYHTSIGLATLPASLLAGLLWQYGGPVIAFSYGALISAAAALLLLRNEAK